MIKTTVKANAVNDMLYGSDDDDSVYRIVCDDGSSVYRTVCESSFSLPLF